MARSQSVRALRGNAGTGMLPDVITLSASLSACNRGKLAERWSSPRQCSSGVPLYVIAHSASISACNRGKQPDRWSSSRQYSTSVLPNAITQSVLINTCGTGKGPERWSSLRRYSLSLLPSVITALCPVIATEASSQSVGAPRGNAAAGAASVITHNALMSTCDKGKQPERWSSLRQCSGRYVT